MSVLCKTIDQRHFSNSLKPKKTGWFLKLYWIMAGLMILTNTALVLCGVQSVHWFISVFFTVGVTLQALYHYGEKYSFYIKGRKAYIAMQPYNHILMCDVRVWVRGFDILSRKKLSRYEYRTAIYQFNVSDIILGEKSLILLGKNTDFGDTAYAIPVELVFIEKQIPIRTAWIKGWMEYNDRIIISIEDEFYKKPFRIDFKDHVKEIREWLISVEATSKRDIGK